MYGAPRVGACPVKIAQWDCSGASCWRPSSSSCAFGFEVVGENPGPITKAGAEIFNCVFSGGAVPLAFYVFAVVVRKLAIFFIVALFLSSPKGAHGTPARAAHSRRPHTAGGAAFCFTGKSDIGDAGHYRVRAGAAFRRGRGA